MPSHSSIGIQCHFPVWSAGSWGLHSAHNRIVLNEVSFIQKEMCSLCLANTSNASLPHIPVLLQMGFILASEEHIRSGTKAERVQKRGIVPHHLGWKSGCGELLLACSRTQCWGRCCTSTRTARLLPGVASLNPRMSTHLGHRASIFGPSWEIEISTQAMLCSLRMQFPNVAKILVIRESQNGQG